MQTAIRTAAFLASLRLVFAQLDNSPQTRLNPELRCLLGVYSLAGNKWLTITGTGGQPRGLQYTIASGEFGTLQETSKGIFTAAFQEPAQNGIGVQSSDTSRSLYASVKIEFDSCASGRLQFTQSANTSTGRHVRLIEKETSFLGDGGVKLHGKLVLPATGRANSIAVWIEGSNNDPSTDDVVWQYELARRGIATFVYDKRGTGASQGAPSSDFNVRARDTVAAVKEAQRLVPKARRVGVIGGSQGGWVAPLTAKLVPLDFMIAAFAMAEGPIAQDRELVELQLRQAGFDETVLHEARKLTAITERIVRSKLTDGFADLDAFKSKFAGAAWLKAIQPRSFTGIFLLFSSEDIRTKGPAMAQGLTFDFEPRPLIESITARQLWLLGGSDSQAPNSATQAILKQIQQKRKDIRVVVFPKADHGLIEQSGNTSHYSGKLFDIAAEWIKR